MYDFTLDDVRTLGAKLDGLELTPGERAALDAMVGEAGDAEVEGFAAPSPVGGVPGSFEHRLATSFGAGFKVEIEGFSTRR